MQRHLLGSTWSATARAGRVLSVMLALFVALPAGAAAADSAGPTDYRSRIVAIDPATPQVHASIIGGDSFLELRVDRGTAVEVLGYRSEPFIRFLADGTVQENRTSASYFVSKARQGAALPADFVDDAPPAWHTVATDGRYAWHDHRVHWMTDSRPPGRHPGDVVLREQVPLLVDDVAVSIIVESVWMPAASRTPVWLGAIVGLAAGLLAGLGGRVGSLSRWRALPTLDVALLATFVGAWQYRTLPTETGPQVGWFALPAIAAAAAAGAVALHWRGNRSSLTSNALLLLAGVNLAAWAWMRREGFSKAILATNAPGWLDRFAAAAAISCGLVTTALGLAALTLAIAAPGRAPATSPTT
ncbi:MAG: hypothetical protein KAY11_13910 [Ilumatobacteraceae bacterium]|nr:hypothetical protein [Ilumatobacteraceae bacterium]